MDILIVHDRIPPGARPDELDTLVQAEAVHRALLDAGQRVRLLAVDLPLDDLARELSNDRPDLVFNLVESLGGSGRTIHALPQLLESLGIPFAGAGARAMQTSSSKLSTKEVLGRAGLPTPAWHTEASLGAAPAADTRGRWLVKSVWEHGSLGLEAEALLEDPSPKALAAAIRDNRAHLGGEAFAECYVHGREFNVALLDGPEGPVCLPPPEIRFEGLAHDAPRIVGYRAKWAVGSAEYDGTPRHFPSDEGDQALLEQLRQLALDCWRAFDLAGWARIDFRVDEAGQPFVIDVNANPCLSPDAGFAATLERAGIDFKEALQRILQAAVCRPA